MKTAGHPTAMFDINLGNNDKDLTKQDVQDLLSLSDAGFSFSGISISK